jgi:hypothetical protein
MRRAFPLLIAVSLCLPLHAQDDRDLSALHQIKVEAFENSKVMDHLQTISDRYGPRLTASPEWEEAAQWVMQAMKSWSLSNVHEEKWGPFGRSWSLESCNLDMISPRYSHLVAYPLAWSSSTKGIESGELFYAPMPTDRDFDKFNDVGIPGFQFIQDPLDYETIAHHSDVDTYSHAVQEDLMQASAVIATLVYDIANRDQMVPRKISVQNGKLPSP